jgi:hypothetical protein
MLGLLLSLLAIVAPAYVNASVSDCSNGKALITIDSMSFKPDPTVPGMNSTLLLSLSVPEEITNGTVTYSTTYNFLPLTPTVEDLCATVVCPIAVGSLDTLSSYPIGTSLSGTLTLKIEWTELTGRQLLCVSIKTKLGAYDKQLVLRKTKNKVCKVNSTFFTNETYRH